MGWMGWEAGSESELGVIKKMKGKPQNTRTSESTPCRSRNSGSTARSSSSANRRRILRTPSSTSARRRALTTRAREPKSNTLTGAVAHFATRGDAFSLTARTSTGSGMLHVWTSRDGRRQAFGAHIGPSGWGFALAGHGRGDHGANLGCGRGLRRSGRARSGDGGLGDGVVVFTFLAGGLVAALFGEVGRAGTFERSGCVPLRLVRVFARTVGWGVAAFACSAGTWLVFGFVGWLGGVLLLFGFLFGLLLFQPFGFGIDGLALEITLVTAKDSQ